MMCDLYFVSAVWAALDRSLLLDGGAVRKESTDWSNGCDAVNGIWGSVRRTTKAWWDAC